MARRIYVRLAVAALAATVPLISGCAASAPGRSAPSASSTPTGAPSAAPADGSQLRSGRQLSSSISVALRAQSSFHITLSSGAAGQALREDIEFSANGGSATITSPAAAGIDWNILSIGPDLFVSTTDAGWRRDLQYHSNPARKLAIISGKYLQVRRPSTLAHPTSLAELASTANRDTFLQKFFGVDGLLSGNYIDRGQATIAGKSVTRYEAVSGASAGVEVDIATSGPPLPIRISTPPSSLLVATIVFTGYGAPATARRYDVTARLVRGVAGRGLTHKIRGLPSKSLLGLSDIVGGPGVF